MPDHLVAHIPSSEPVGMMLELDPSIIWTLT